MILALCRRLQNDFDASLSDDSRKVQMDECAGAGNSQQASYVHLHNPSGDPIRAPMIASPRFRCFAFCTIGSCCHLSPGSIRPRAVPAIIQHGIQELSAALLPREPRDIGRGRNSVAQREPTAQCVCQRLRIFAREIVSVLTCHFSEHWNIPRNDRQVVLGRFDQREAEAFAFRSGQQGIRYRDRVVPASRR